MSFARATTTGTSSNSKTSADQVVAKNTEARWRTSTTTTVDDWRYIKGGGKMQNAGVAQQCNGAQAVEAGCGDESQHGPSTGGSTSSSMGIKQQLQLGQQMMMWK
jgi:hypothetical protein